MSVDFERNQPAHEGFEPKVGEKNAPQSDSGDSRSPEQQEKDNELAERLSSIIEDANRRVVPLVKMIRQVHSLLSSS